ncbi:MAG TPA: hypothetical protein VGR57_09515, partial [Ktedonobacterales bacterium]|nr:hypothetical protein [Ktedonobacterales bacterium]
MSAPQASVPSASVPPASAQQRSATRRLTTRYSLALITIAVLGLLGQIVVQVSIQQLSRDTHVIDVAAREHMLSERMTKASLALLVVPYPATQSVYMDEIRSIAPEWQHAYLALQTGDATLGLPGHNSPAVQQIFGAIAMPFTQMQDAIIKVEVAYAARPPIATADVPAFESVIGPYVDELLVGEPDFSAGMDQIAAQY